MTQAPLHAVALLGLLSMGCVESPSTASDAGPLAPGPSDGGPLEPSLDGGPIIDAQRPAEDAGSRPCSPQHPCPEGHSCSVTGECHDGECLDYPTNSVVCGEQECGPTSFGAVCGECEDGGICNSDGVCVAECTADCEAKACGPDGCGGLCGAGSGQDDPCAGLPCGPDGQCVSQEDCVPDCTSALCTEGGACALKNCGSDGCGGSCGECPDAQLCCHKSYPTRRAERRIAFVTAVVWM